MTPSNWVECPICGQPDMRMNLDGEGNATILCTNHACRSNGGSVDLWVERLQRTEQTLTCVYCGKEYPPGSPSHGASVLTEHIKVCEKHPMRALETEITRLRGYIQRLKDYPCTPSENPYKCKFSKNSVANSWQSHACPLHKPLLDLEHE